MSIKNIRSSGFHPQSQFVINYNLSHRLHQQGWKNTLKCLSEKTQLKNPMTVHLIYKAMKQNVNYNRSQNTSSDYQIKFTHKVVLDSVGCVGINVGLSTV